MLEREFKMLSHFEDEGRGYGLRKEVTLGAGNGKRVEAPLRGHLEGSSATLRD